MREVEFEKQRVERTHSLRYVQVRDICIIITELHEKLLRQLKTLLQIYTGKY